MSTLQFPSSRSSATAVVAASETSEARALRGSPSGNTATAKNLLIAFWSFVFFFGVVEFWISRDAMNTDGISYLDVASAFTRHDWSAGVNAYWSPLYPFFLSLVLRLLKPAPYWEFTAVHLANFLIFVGSAAAFHFFLSRLMLFRSSRTTPADSPERSALPEWAMMAIGYTLFLWSSLKLTPLAVVSPDMAVALFVYLAAGIVLGMHAGKLAGIRHFFLLGIVLGLAYLAKAPMLPVGIIFLAIAFFSPGGIGKSAARTAVAAITMILVASPFVLTLSREQGHVTWGDSAKLNYAWYVNHIPRYHWQGTPPRYGTPDHPTKQIFDDPPVYAFDGSKHSTYSVWFDPTYWNSGVRPAFDGKAILRQVFTNALVYDDVIFHQQAAVVAICLLLFLIGGQSKSLLADWAEYRILLIPAAAAFCMYVLVHVEERMISAFLVLAWMALFASVRYRDLPETRRCASLAIVAVVLLTMVTLTESVLGETASHGPRELVSSSAANPEWQIADQLHRAGVKPGDKIAWMRPTLFTAKQNYAWARLAGVRIVAEVPTGEESRFWAVSSETRAKIFDAVAQTGARAFVVTEIPAGVSNSDWQPLGATGYWVHGLR